MLLIALICGAIMKTNNFASENANIMLNSFGLTALQNSGGEVSA